MQLFNDLSRLHLQSIFTRMTPPDVNIFVCSSLLVSTISRIVPTRKIGHVRCLVRSKLQRFRYVASAWMFFRITLKRGNSMKFLTKIVKFKASRIGLGTSRSFSTGHQPSNSQRPVVFRSEWLLFRHLPGEKEISSMKTTTSSRRCYYPSICRWPRTKTDVQTDVFFREYAI